MVAGIPWVRKIVNIAWPTESESTFFNGMASGNFVYKRIAVSKYLKPEAERGKESTISRANFWNDSETIGRGWSGNLGSVCLVFF